MITDYMVDLKKRIYKARERATSFLCSLKTDKGFKYTASHDPAVYPAATLYGSWSAILGLQLAGELTNFSVEDRLWALARLIDHRRQNRTFLGIGLEKCRNSKSLEYLILHCTNYSLGAALSLDPNFDFEAHYLHRFLDGDVLAYWLDARSFLRPWEEGNNIVNVASYLAMCHEGGEPKAQARLEQMLEWHNQYQNPKTGGFDSFSRASTRNLKQAMAGAVHNFHLHFYLEQPLRFESLIAENVANLLVDGPLTACFSIDFVELAVRSIVHAPDPQLLTWALVSHAEALLHYQRSDGGWLENASPLPTSAAGFNDEIASSCSYATWFRLASLGMIAIVLCGDNPDNWKFRNTLGMGYAPHQWPSLPAGVKVEKPPINHHLNISIRNFRRKSKEKLIQLGSRLI